MQASTAVLPLSLKKNLPTLAVVGVMLLISLALYILGTMQVDSPPFNHLDNGVSRSLAPIEPKLPNTNDRAATGIFLTEIPQGGVLLNRCAAGSVADAAVIAPNIVQVTCIPANEGATP